jgi:hypothetical protein
MTAANQTTSTDTPQLSPETEDPSSSSSFDSLLQTILQAYHFLVALSFEPSAGLPTARACENMPR